MTQRGLLCVVLFGFAFSLTLVGPVSAFKVISDDTWKTTDVNPGPGWEQIGFDDSGWRNAFAPYPNSVSGPDVIIGGAKFMWFWNPKNGTPTGQNGPVQAWFRNTFYTVDPAKVQQFRASAEIIADDFFRLFINGMLETNDKEVQNLAEFYLEDRIALNAAEGCPIVPCDLGKPVEYDINSALTSATDEGKNVIAIYAFDGSKAFGPFDREFEYVLFATSNIEFDLRPVPGPPTLLLLAAGFLCAATVLRRNR